MTDERALRFQLQMARDGNAEQAKKIRAIEEKNHTLSERNRLVESELYLAGVAMKSCRHCECFKGDVARIEGVLGYRVGDE